MQSFKCAYFFIYLYSCYIISKKKLIACKDSKIYVFSDKKSRITIKDWSSKKHFEDLKFVKILFDQALIQKMVLNL